MDEQNLTTVKFCSSLMLVWLQIDVVIRRCGYALCGYALCGYAHVVVKYGCGYEVMYPLSLLCSYTCILVYVYRCVVM